MPHKLFTKLKAIVFGLALLSLMGANASECITGGQFLDRDPYGAPAPGQTKFLYNLSMRSVSLGAGPAPRLDKAMFLYVPSFGGPVVPNDWCYEPETRTIRFLSAYLRHNGRNYPYAGQVPAGTVVSIHYYPRP